MKKQSDASATGTLSVGDLTLGDVTLSLVEQDGVFQGIGQVRTAGGVQLRSDSRPMLVDLRSPTGTQLLNWRVKGIEPGENGAVELTLGADRQDGGPMEFMLHTVRLRYNMADWSRGAVPAPGVELKLKLWSVKREFGGRSFSGFGYQYHFKSQDIGLYKILDRSSWELGGSSIGNQVWMRGAEPSVMTFKSVEDFYSSEWYLPGIANPNIFQFKPLQTQLQGFTFTAHEKGVLVTWTPKVAHVRTLLQKDNKSDVIVHLHEHCTDLANEISSPPMEVLFWAQEGLNEVDLANCYEAVRELVHDTLHQDIDMKRERLQTSGMIEQWCVPDVKQYATLGVPALLEVGVKCIEVANYFENNSNVYGISNMCCTLDLKFSDVIGEQNVKLLCDTAKAGGAMVRMWGNTAISTISSLFYPYDGKAGWDENTRPLTLKPSKDSVAWKFLSSKAAFVRDATGSHEADHYRPRFALMNLRDESVRQYWMESWTYAHDKVGISGIFLDSSFNLSSDKFHFRQDRKAKSYGGATADQAHLLVHHRPLQESPSEILSEYMAHLTLMRQMQKVGYSISGEDHGVFGLHRAGFNLGTNIDRIYLWADCLQSMDAEAIKKFGRDVDDIYFRGWAYRMVWLIHWLPETGKLSFQQGQSRGEYDKPSPWQLKMVRVYNEVEPLLYNRTILPGQSGVTYDKDGVKVLWSFEPMKLDLPKGKFMVREMISGKQQPAEKSVQAEARQVLVIWPAEKPSPVQGLPSSKGALPVA